LSQVIADFVVIEGDLSSTGGLSFYVLWEPCMSAFIGDG